MRHGLSLLRVRGLYLRQVYPHQLHAPARATANRYVHFPAAELIRDQSHQLARDPGLTFTRIVIMALP